MFQQPDSIPHSRHDTTGTLRPQAASHTVTDTVQKLHAVSDTLPKHHAKADTTLLRHEESADTLSICPDTLLHLREWPVTLWNDTLETPCLISSILTPRGHNRPLTATAYPPAAALFVGSFLVIILILALARKHLVKQFRNFFTPTNNQEKAIAVSQPCETYAPLTATLLLCVNSGLLLFATANQQYHFEVGLLSPHVVLAVCIAFFAAYHALRWLLYRFVNWIFFSVPNRHAWNTGYSFLLTLESLALLPLVIAAMNRGWDVKTTAISVVSLYFLTRILLLYHSYRIFFSKNYGFLHLFAYLCTLELIPLLSLWKTIEYISNVLIVK